MSLDTNILSNIQDIVRSEVNAQIETLEKDVFLEINQTMVDNLQKRSSPS